MSFIEDLRTAQQWDDEDRQREADIINGWNDRFDSATNLFKEYYKKTGQGNLDDQFAHEKLRDFIYKNGLKDGKWKNEDYDELDFQQYGSELLDKLFDGAQTFDDYVTNNASKSVQRTYERDKTWNNAGTGEKAFRLGAGGSVLSLANAGGPLTGAPANAAAVGMYLHDKKNNKTLDDMYANYQQGQESIYDNAFKLIEDYDKYADIAATSD